MRVHILLAQKETIEGKLEYLKQQNNQLEAFLEVFLFLFSNLRMNLWTGSKLLIDIRTTISSSNITKLQQSHPLILISFSNIFNYVIIIYGHFLMFANLKFNFYSNNLGATLPVQDFQQ